MPRITLDTPHSLGQDEALKRLHEKFNAARLQFGSDVKDFKEEWTDHTLNFSFSSMGMSVRGSVKVEDTVLRLQAELPLAATFFKGAIEKRLREEMDVLLK